MEIIKSKFRKDILEKRFEGNYTKCAHALEVEVPQLHRFINNDRSKAGAKLLGGFYAYCEKENLNFRDYIFLPTPSTAVYGLTGTE
ncbi:hypothetical protein [Desulforamulus aquiferis]|uniref:Transcriptional regulator n=1 Tax=Desulforamulus aquiferis TaxID=1397668 RepID=A0AAW7ZIX6_9FIRM|nr:hypothetical protein [Desulforamulus aquiferis]MDO7789123.1 hypothetical protein [Desulforamulus aquiferis]